MFKKIYLLGLIILLFFPITTAFALNDNYTNKNGVKITKKEFDFINEFYGEEYFEKMTLDDYLWLKDLDINNRKIEIKTVLDIPKISLYGTSISTVSKKLTIAKSCSSMCNILVNTSWIQNPNNRSYDVIGARFQNTSLASNNIMTRVSSSGSNEYFSDNKISNNGFGTSIKLPNAGSSIMIEQKFVVYKNGTVFASYQHSMQNISLSTSKLYTINSSGYGRVFAFYGNASNIFDNMSGVDINV